MTSSRDSTSSCFSSCASRRHSWSVLVTSWFFRNWCLFTVASFFIVDTISRSSVSFLLLSCSSCLILSFSFSISSKRSFTPFRSSLSWTDFIRKPSSVEELPSSFSGETWVIFSVAITFPLKSVSSSLDASLRCLASGRWFVVTGSNPTVISFSLIILFSLLICTSSFSFFSSWW